MLWSPRPWLARVRCEDCAFERLVSFSEHKHLDGVFEWPAAQQQERDAVRLANPKITLREKERVGTGAALRTPTPSTPQSGHLYFGQRRTLLLWLTCAPPLLLIPAATMSSAEFGVQYRRFLHTGSGMAVANLPDVTQIASTGRVLS